jgi:hypothetical protein
MRRRPPWEWLIAVVAVVGALSLVWYLLAGPALSRVLTAAGLALDIAGVVIFARSAFIGPDVTRGIGLIGGGPGRLREYFAQNQAEGAVGLSLIGLGFAAQLVAGVWPPA